MPSRRQLGRFVAVVASALAAVTCDLVTGPTTDSGITVEYTGPAVLTVGQTVDFDFTVLDNTVPIEGARVRVVSSDPDIIEVQGNEFAPRLFVKARGQATITATLLGSTLGSNPPFVAEPIIAVVNALIIDSASVTFRSLADTVRLHAEASDFNNQLISGAGASARWSTTDVAIVQVDSISGRITARGNGTAQVIARLDSTADTTQVIVQQRLVRFAFTPVNLVLNALNLDTVVTVTPLDQGGTALATGAPAFTTTMTSLNAGIASVVRLTNTTFRVTSQGNSLTATGVRVVDAINGVADDTLSVAVGQIAQSMVITTALSDTIDAFQDTLRVRARAFDARNVEVQGRAISWTSANTSVATVDQTGLVTGQTAATVNIQAKMDAATALASIHVRNTPRSVVLSLDSVRITTINDTIIVGVTARNRLGATVAGTAVTWQSLDAAIAQVTTSGAVIATGVGNTRVIASIAGGYADTLRVRVTNDPTSVDIVPTSVTLASVGDSAVPAVTIQNSRGAALGRTAVTWRSTDTVVTVTATGIIVARAAGSTFVTATTPDSARADTVVVTVTNAPETVTLNRVLDTLTAPTRTLQYDAVVRNTRSAVISGAAVNWRSSNASVASVSPAGLATALAIGQTLIIGEATGAGGLRADTSRLIVTNDVVSLTVSPTNLTIPSVGATATITADPRNAVGASVSGVAPIWTTSDANVATVDATGTVTGVAVGTATITGDVAGKTATSAVTVTNAPDTIVIVPTAVTLASVNDSTTPAVHFTNALGAVLPRSAAQWTSNDGAIAQVTTNGIIVATGRGTTLVRAVNALNPARRDSITVTVTNAPTSINVLRFNDVLPSVNRTLSYAADVFNARGDLIPTEPVTWVSRDQTVAVISSAGVATSVGIGVTRIVGTAGSVSDSATLTVNNSAATVSISPATLTLNSIGDTATLTATARNELGNVIPSPTVSWQSSNTLIATVTVAGKVTAQGTGTAQVSATVDGITTSIAVSVQNTVAVIQITSPDTTLASIGDLWIPAVNIRNSLNAPLPRNAVLWTSGNSNVATVTGSGDVTATGAGATTITATSPTNGSLFASRTVTVTNAPASIVLSRPGPPSNDTLTALTRTLQLTAVVRNAATNVIASPSITWSSSGAATASVDATGLVTANAVGGPVRIVAVAGSVRDTVNVVVTNDAVSLALSPDTVTVLDTNGTIQLTAVARNDLNNLVSGSAITWTSLTPAVATVNGSGLVDVKSVGVVAITASVNSGPALRADTTFVTVVNAPRTINIVPASRALTSVGDTAYPQTAILNSTSQSLPRSAVLWTSSAPNVASVNNLGEVTSLATGSTTITATSPYDPTLFDSYTVTVTDAPASVAISNTAVTLTALTRTFTFTATVRNARGTPLTGQTVTYNSLNAARVSVGTTSGTATAVDTTTGTKIAVVVSGAPTVSDTAVVTVTNNPTTVTVTPTAVAYSAVGDSSLVTLTANNDLGNPITHPQVQWTTNNQAVVKFLPTGGGATVGPTITTLDSVRLKAVGAGSTSITVTTGGVTTSVNVTVSNNLDTVQITPASGSITSLQDTLFPAVRFTNSLGVSLGRTAATWSSSNPSVATVTTDGVITGVAIGTARVYAVSPSNAALKDSIDVTVTNDPAIVTLSLAGPDTLTGVGQQLTYTATVKNARNATIAGASVTWNSSNTGAATIDAAGNATATGTGASTNITATSGTVTSAASVIFVINPVVLYVNKDSVSGALHNGTLRRPYTTIQSALNVADPGDSILVKRAGSAYSEVLTISVPGLTIAAMPADSTSAGCSTGTGRCATPGNLPTLAHNSGAQAIRIANGAGLTLRHFAITHAVNGPAIQADTANLVTDFVYVNPALVSAAGSGIIVRDDGSSAVAVRRTVVRQVKGYGVRLENVSGGRVDSTHVETVSSFGGTQVGVHVIGGSNNSILRTRFVATTGQDGLRLQNTRNAVVTSDTIAGGRHALYADTSSVTSSASFFTGGVTSFWLAARDTLTSTGDSLASTSQSCVAATGDLNVITLSGSRIAACATASIDTAAVTVDGPSNHVTLSGSRIRGMNRSIVRFASGRALHLVSDTLVGDSTTGGALAGAVITTTTADSLVVSRSKITDFRRRPTFDASVGTGGLLRLDSNTVTRQRVGVVFGTVTGATVLARRNDLFNFGDSIALANAPSLDTLRSNWFGDSLGPRRGTLRKAVGDSISVGTVDVSAGLLSFPLDSGVTASQIVAIRGSGESNADSVHLAVRVVDAAGRPVKGVTVHFASSDNGDDMDPGSGGSQDNLNVTTDRSGIARVRLDFDATAGARTMTITATGLTGSPISYTVTKL